MKSISVVIVSWNAKEHLRRCLESIREHADDCVLETIVIDNDSADGSADMVATEFREALLVRAGANLGFGRANNIGFARARGDFVAMINSDVTLHPECLQRLEAYLRSDPAACLAAPRIVGRAGALQLTCKHLPSLWNTFCRFAILDRLLPGVDLFSGFDYTAARHASASRVPAIGGCFWLLRKTAIEQVGPFDERFFFYAEDIDWCKRFGENGWSVVYFPQASATHYGGGSSEKAPVRYSVEIIRSTLQYWRKHHGRLRHALCFLMFVAHHAIKLVTRLFVWLLSGGRSLSTSRKMAQDYSCLRWLLTRDEASSGRGPSR
jgi:GT2 family glycosyltransferase